MTPGVGRAGRARRRSEDREPVALRQGRLTTDPRYVSISWSNSGGEHQRSFAAEPSASGSLIGAEMLDTPAQDAIVVVGGDPEARIRQRLVDAGRIGAHQVGAEARPGLAAWGRAVEDGPVVGRGRAELSDVELHRYRRRRLEAHRGLEIERGVLRAGARDGDRQFEGLPLWVAPLVPHGGPVP